MEWCWRNANHPDYAFNTLVAAANMRVDVALMRWDEPIPYPIAEPYTLHGGRVAGTEISFATYDCGRDRAIMRQRFCNIPRRMQGLISFNCDITVGSSDSSDISQYPTLLADLPVVSALAF